MSDPEYGETFECDVCGRDCHLRLGGECLRKCSESVPIDDLRELADTFREWADQYDAEYSDLSENQKTTVANYNRCADEVEKLVGDE